MSAIAAGGRLRKAAELRRFLGKDHAEILRMMDEDGLPYVDMPGRGSLPQGSFCRMCTTGSVSMRRAIVRGLWISLRSCGLLRRRRAGNFKF